MNQFRGRDASPRYYFVDYGPGPGWTAGRPLMEQPLAEHLAFVRTEFTAGRVVVGGPIHGEDRGMYLVAARDESDARAFADHDPGVQRGIFRLTLRPWSLMFGAALP
jgi:uncharacterized protein YciI